MMIKTGKKDYIWSYIAYILRFGVNLFVFPLVLKILNPSEYGLWVTFASLGVIVNLFDFGFSSTLLRNMTYVWSGASDLQEEGYKPLTADYIRDDRTFVLTFQTCQRIYLFIALIAFVISNTAGIAYVLYIIRDIYTVEYLIAWIIYGISISLNLYYAYWAVSLKSVGAIAQSQKATVFGFLVQIAISYIGLLLGGGIIVLSIAACLSGIIIRIMSRAFFVRYNNIGEILKRKTYSINKQERIDSFRTMWFNAKRAGISSVATVSMIQSTTIFSSAYYGVAITGEYGLCFQLLSALTGISQIHYQTSLPQLTQARLMNDLKKCQNLFSTSIVMSWLIYVIGVLTIIIFGKPILLLLESQTSLNIPILIIMALYMLGEMNYSMHASYISLENKLPFVSSVVITSIAVIALSFINVQTSYGILGLLMIRLLIESIYIFWKWPVTAHQQLQMSSVKIVCTGFKEWYIIIKRQLDKLKIKKT